MPRARSTKTDHRQTAASHENASGCLSFYALPPLAVLLIATLIALLASRTPTQTAALPNTDGTTLSPIFTREIQHWSADILRWARASSLDPNLVATIMQIESCGDPRALSRSGAMGLFQVMPFHFHFGENGFNPETNALRGLDYLARSLETANGDPRLAMAGYNGGIGVITRSEWTWHAETKRYVQYGTPIYADAQNGVTSSPMLTEWYDNYGASLCHQAAQRLGLP